MMNSRKLILFKKLLIKNIALKNRWEKNELVSIIKKVFKEVDSAGDTNKNGKKH